MGCPTASRECQTEHTNDEGFGGERPIKGSANDVDDRVDFTSTIKLATLTPYGIPFECLTLRASVAKIGPSESP